MKILLYLKSQSNEETTKGASIKDVRLTRGRGDLGKLNIYCYFHRNSTVKPGQTGEGGLKILILTGRPWWMPPKRL